MLSLDHAASENAGKIFEPLHQTFLSRNESFTEKRTSTQICIYERKRNLRIKLFR